MKTIMILAVLLVPVTASCAAPLKTKVSQWQQLCNGRPCPPECVTTCQGNRCVTRCTQR